MNFVNSGKLTQWYLKNFEKEIKGNYLTFEMILPLIEALELPFFKEIIGYSFKQTPIYRISIGKGPIKVLLWSQMHGNESTGTKALFDLFKFLTNPQDLLAVRDQILNTCTLVFIPMLNPDGAKSFTRINAQGIDLNRDAIALKAPETLLLKHVLHTVNPMFCFNLHDQRTIFNVANTKNPASISFLAPSVNKMRTVTKGRKKTMSVIVSMNTLLQKLIPNHIGRFTDEFYPLATGDNFQKAGHNTILIEAGHYKNDYEREKVRAFNFYALVQGLYFITFNDFFNYKPYFNIPNNEKKCFDIIYRNAKYQKNNTTDIALQYVYKIEKGKLIRTKELAKTGNLNAYFGHQEIDLKGQGILIKNLLNS